MQFLQVSERCAVIELGPNLSLRVWLERGRAIAQFVECNEARGAAAISVPYAPPAVPPPLPPAHDPRAPTRKLAVPLR